MANRTYTDFSYVYDSTHATNASIVSYPQGF